MITILPDQSYHLPSSVSDEITHPTINFDNSIKIEKEVLENKKKYFTFSNILLALIVLFLVAGVYFYFLEPTPENKITEAQKKLLDISTLEESSGKTIGKGAIRSRPNDGSTSVSSQDRPTSNTNDRSQRSSKPIPKTQSSYSNHVIGSGNPEGNGDDGDDDDEDPNRRNQLHEDSIYSDNEQDEDSQSQQEEDLQMEGFNYMEQRWTMPEEVSNRGPPLVGSPQN